MWVSQESRLIALFLIALTTLLVGEHVLLGPYAPIIFGDNAEYVVPEIISGQFDNSILGDSWNRFLGGGVERAACGQCTPFYTLVYRILPVWGANSLIVLSQAVAATVGAYLLSRRVLETSVVSALFVATVYGSMLTHYYPHSFVAYLPLALTIFSTLLDAPRSPALWGAAICALIVLSGTAFFSRLFPIAGMIMAWFVFIERRSIWAIVVATLFALSLFLLRIDDLRTLIAITPHSQLAITRAPEELDGYFQAIISIAVSAPTLILLALFNISDHHLGRRILIGLFLTATAIALTPFVVWAISSTIFPAAKGFSATHIVTVAALILPFVAGKGLDRVKAKNHILAGILIVAALLPSTANLLNAKAGVVFNWINHGSITRNFDSNALRDVAKRIHAQSWPIRVEPFQLYPNLLHTYGIETLGGYAPVYSLRFFEFWGTMVGRSLEWPGAFPFTEESINRRASIKHFLPFRSERLMLYPAEFNSKNRLDERYNIEMLSLGNVGFVISRDELTDEGMELIQGPQKPWSSLSPVEKIITTLEENRSGRSYFYLYRNLNVFPRFFSVEKARILPSEEELFATLSEQSLQNLKSTAFYTADDPGTTALASRRFSPADIDLLSYENDEIRLRTTAKGESLLVVSNTVSPLWRCEIDGIAAPIIPAYGTFWSIVIPPGSHHIQFTHGLEK